LVDVGRRALPTLLDRLRQRNPDTYGYLAGALAHLGPEAEDVLIDELKGTLTDCPQSYDIRIGAGRVLLEEAAVRAMPWLIVALRRATAENDYNNITGIAYAMERAGDEVAVPPLIDTLIRPGLHYVARPDVAYVVRQLATKAMLSGESAALVAKYRTAIDRLD
jgi:hypothetical protein